MKTTYTLLILCFSAVQCTMAQSPENKSWSIDYDLWNNNGTPALSINCGTDEAFNFSGDFTLELWVRAFQFVENRKLIGKCSADDNVFDNGYIMGFINQHVYTEYFNPTSQQVPVNNGDGAMPVDSAYVHLASVYSLSEGKLYNYINGNLSGETDMFPSEGVAPDLSPFIIGNAPWDMFSFQFYGDIDEVRAWDTALSSDDLKARMHLNLQGDENNLVAYYDFNTAAGDQVPDRGPHSFDGTMSNSDHVSTGFLVSSAPVADLAMYDMQDVQAAWYRTEENFHKITSDNGFSVITDIAAKEFKKYLVMGNTNSVGISPDNAPSTAPLDFNRTAREWYVKCSSDVSGTFTVDLAEAGGALIQDNSPLDQYALLWRPNTSEDFIALVHPTSPIPGIFQFQNFDFMDGYYAFGYSAEPFELQTSVQNLSREVNISTFPNPTDGLIYIAGTVPGDHIDIYTQLGGLVYSTTSSGSKHTKLDLNHLPKGTYTVKVTSTKTNYTQRLILQ